MITKAYIFTCEICGMSEVFAAENISNAKQEAKVNGWISSRYNGCFCSKECHLENALLKGGE